MSLGEAIVRCTLNSPKYVLSVFPYQQNFEKYRQRIRGIKSKAAAGTFYKKKKPHGPVPVDGQECSFGDGM